MKVVVNGESKELSAGTTIEAVVADVGAGARLGVAVAVNGEVVPRSTWSEATLNEGDQVEVLRAIGGG